MLEAHSSYRTYLREELAKRIELNPAYSLRLFAHELGIGHSFACEVLRGKNNLSARTAPKVAARLGLKGDAGEYFCAMVQWEVARDRESKELAGERLRALRPATAPHDLDFDRFKLISDWYPFAILELTKIEGFVLTPDSAAAELGIGANEAAVAMDRLERLSLLKRDADGTYLLSDARLLVRSEQVEEALIKFNLQSLEKAAAAVREQPYGRRFSGTETLALGPGELAEASRLQEEFLAGIRRLAARAGRKDRVIHVTTHVFELTTAEKPPRGRSKEPKTKKETQK